MLRPILQDDVGRDRFDLLTVTVLVDCERIMRFVRRAAKSVGRDDDPVSPVVGTKHGVVDTDIGLAPRDSV